jgi:DNA-directed RNA polymerase subunit RPC12/RpoP
MTGDGYDWHEPVAERERIEAAYERLYRCPRCGADVPGYATEAIDVGQGRVCVPCATGARTAREVF